MTVTKFLRFVNEDLCKAALEPAGAYIPPVVDPDDSSRMLRPGQYVNAGHGWACDVVGVIYDPATYDEDGNELTPAVPHPGWHVNYSGDMPESLKAYLISPEPATPHRVFF